MPELTSEQQQAVDANHQRILVSASAGTGKTHVLTQRYLRLVLRDGVEVRQILAVTFTEAAAAEMRSRIAQTLRSQFHSGSQLAQTDWLYRQLLSLERSPICTLHSFCLRVVREFFYLLDLDPDFSVLDPAEAEVLKRDAVEETLEGWFEEQPADMDSAAFYQLVDEYGGLLAGERLPYLLLELHTFLETLPDPETWWKIALSVYQGADSASGNSEHWRRIWEAIPVQAHTSTLAELRQLAPLVTTLYRLYQSFAENYWKRKLVRTSLDFADLERLAQRLLRQHPQVLSQLRRRFRHILVDEYQDINPLQNDILETLAGRESPSVRQLFMVGDDKQSIYGFRLACPALFQEKVLRYLRLVPNPADANNCAAPADTCPSEAITSLAISGGAISVSKVADHESGICVPLTRNFRSRRTILEAVNALFQRIAETGGFGMRYDDTARLVFAAPPYEAANGDPVGDEEPVTLHVLSPFGEGSVGSEDEESSSPAITTTSWERLEREAHLAAQLIQQWVGQRWVWDADHKKFRLAEYRDVAILMRTVQGRAQTVVQALRRLGIPVHAELRRGFWEALEIRDMIALLQLLRNPLDDVPLAAVLRSPLVGLEVVELARIRLAHREGPFYLALHRFIADYHQTSLAQKIRGFLALLQHWRTRARRQPVARWLWDIYRETGYLAFVQALPDGAARAANLVLLHDLARQLEQSVGGDLDRFLHYLERLREHEQDFGPSSVVAPGENVVRLTSIHQSKGLEYPLVIVLDLGSQFNQESLHGPFLFHRDGLLGAKVQDERGVYQWPSALYQHIRQRLRADFLAEELRLLYVAMTRARECLALIGTHNRFTLPQKGNAEPQDPTAIPPPEKLLSPLQWLLPTFRWAQGRGLASLRLQEWSPGEMVARSVANMANSPADHTGHTHQCPASAACTDAGDRSQLDESALQQLLQRVTWQYPYQPATRWPGKTSPTQWRLWLAHDSETIPMSRWQFRWRAVERPSFVTTAPSGLSASQRGQLTHRFLRHLELRGPIHQEQELRRQLAKLVEEQVFTQCEADAVNVAAIANFFRRPLGRRLCQAHQLRRELPFSLMLPATDLPFIIEQFGGQNVPADRLGSEKILVQGVMDLLFWEKAASGPVLVDFKTDDLHPNELFEAQQRYAPQLALYARAVEEALGEPCREVWLVFLTTEQDVLLDKEILARCLQPSRPSS